MPASTSSSLADKKTFPSLLGLPSKHDSAYEVPHFLDSDYFDDAGSRTRHYCFLGHIESLAVVMRAVLHVRDRDGNRGNIAFYDANTGHGVEGMKVGRTVAIADPMFHEFLDGSTGIRVEDDGIAKVKVLDAPLDAILEAEATLSDSSRSDKRCDECHTVPDGDVKLSQCAGCKVMHYCGRDCQTKSWLASHKGKCKALKSAKFLTSRNWTQMGEGEGFPVANS